MPGQELRTQGSSSPTRPQSPGAAQGQHRAHLPPRLAPQLPDGAKDGGALSRLNVGTDPGVPILPARRESGSMSPQSLGPGVATPCPSTHGAPHSVSSVVPHSQT